MKDSNKVTSTADKIQNTVCKPFVADLKANITSRFSSSTAVVSALSIFDPGKCQNQIQCLCPLMEITLSRN